METQKPRQPAYQKCGTDVYLRTDGNKAWQLLVSWDRSLFLWVLVIRALWTDNQSIQMQQVALLSLSSKSEDIIVSSVLKFWGHRVNSVFKPKLDFGFFVFPQYSVAINKQQQYLWLETPQWFFFHHCLQSSMSAPFSTPYRCAHSQVLKCPLWSYFIQAWGLFVH